VAFTEDGEQSVGEAAKTQVGNNHMNTLYYAKRIMVLLMIPTSRTIIPYEKNNFSGHVYKKIGRLRRRLTCRG
jgi:molecular chaperone DnaK (HSP70)